MDQGDQGRSGLEAADAARAETEAAVEAASGRRRDVPAEPFRADPPSPEPEGIGGDPGDAGPDAWESPVCPFLRLERAGLLSMPADGPDADHRCAALSAPVPVSTAQQTLVCLVSTHVDCPRFLRGSHVMPVAAPERRPAIPRATLAAASVLGLSLAATLAYTAANGGLSIPIAPDTPPPASAAMASAGPPTPSVGASASTGPASTGSPSPAPSATASPATSPSPVSGSTPSPGAAHSPLPSGATADRLALLQPCPDRPDCYVYVVRSGDNLTSIGLYFGVPFDTLLRLNPWIADAATIHKGDRIILTTPTR